MEVHRQYNLRSKKNIDNSNKKNLENSAIIYFNFKEKWLDFYLDNGIQVFLWNYRGYGNSSGTVNFEVFLLFF